MNNQASVSGFRCAVLCLLMLLGASVAHAQPADTVPSTVIRLAPGPDSPVFQHQAVAVDIIRLFVAPSVAFFQGVGDHLALGAEAHTVYADLGSVGFRLIADYYPVSLFDKYFVGATSSYSLVSGVDSGEYSPMIPASSLFTIGGRLGLTYRKVDRFSIVFTAGADYNLVPAITDALDVNFSAKKKGFAVTLGILAFFAWH